MQNILDGKVVPMQAAESEAVGEVEEAAENTVQKEEDMIQETVRASEVEAEEKQ